MFRAPKFRHHVATALRSPVRAVPPTAPRSTPTPTPAPTRRARPGPRAARRAAARRSAAATRDAKRAVSALDFEDLELRANRAAARARAGCAPATPSASAHVMVDEFQDTNPLQLELIERIAGERTCSRSATSSSRSTASATPTSSCSARGARRWPSAARRPRCATNFRSHREMLDALNLAFAPRFDASFTPLVPDAAERATPAGGAARRAARRRQRRRLGAPSSSRRASSRRRRCGGSPRRGARGARRASCSPTAAAPGDVVLLLRATGDLPSTSARSRSAACRRT